jgi:hypothetical protein
VRVRVKGGGHTSQIYAIRQAIAKAVVAYFAKYVDAFSAIELKKKLVAYDRTLLIADPRRMEPKKFGGAGARARRQKRCVVLICPRFFANEPDSPSVIGDGYALLLYVCVVKCRNFFHYQYVMTPCNNYAAMQLSVSPSKCIMSMAENPIIHCIVGKTTTRFACGTLCLLLNTSPFAWPFFIFVFVGDEQSLALVIIENGFATLN